MLVTNIKYTNGLENEKQFSAVQFFEVLSPENSRDPKWPVRLGLKDQTNLTKAMFEKLILGNWRLVYHCKGEPVLAASNLYDGISEPDPYYREYGFFEKSVALVSEVSKGGAKYSVRHTYSVDLLPDGKFQLGLSHLESLLVGPSVHIDETDELAFRVTSPFLQTVECKDGSPIETLIVPLPAPSF